MICEIFILIYCIILIRVMNEALFLRFSKCWIEFINRKASSIIGCSLTFCASLLVVFGLMLTFLSIGWKEIFTKKTIKVIIFWSSLILVGLYLIDFPGCNFHYSIGWIHLVGTAEHRKQTVFSFAWKLCYAVDSIYCIFYFTRKRHQSNSQVWTFVTFTMIGLIKSNCITTTFIQHKKRWM